METIKILKGWSTRDGETKIFAFSSEEERFKFFTELKRDADARVDSEYYWSHDWEEDDLIIDPKPPLGL